jgi:peroxiredoxin
MRFSITLFLTFLLTVSVFAQTKNKVKPLAENFTATSLDGRTFDLNDFRGKVVLLTFWSTKCPICHNEIPKLNRLAQNHKDNDVVFLGLTMENPDKVKSYLKKTTFDFSILPNSFGVVLQYADKDGDGKISMGFPAHYLINQKGEIELRTNGFAKTEILNSRINQLLTAK